MDFVDSRLKKTGTAGPLHQNAEAARARAEVEANLLAQRIAALKETPSYERLRDVFDSCKANVGTQTAVAAGERAWVQALWSGAMVAEGLIGGARSPTATVELYFGGTVLVRGTEPGQDPLADRWREGFEMAVLGNYDELVESFVKMKLADLRARSCPDAPEGGVRYVHALQGIFSRADDVGSRLHGALEAIVKPDADDFTLRLLGAEVECLYAVLLRDSAKLDAALSAGLAEHKKYWTKPERESNPEGLLALGLSFAAKVGTMMNVPITTQSPYLVYAAK